MTTDRIPRVGDQITSAEDLDALPVGSVVVDRMHDAALHLFVGQWQYAESQLVQQTYAARYAPFTVLYVPGEQPRPSVTDDTRAGQCPAHKPVQHRDGKPPWCNRCGLTAAGTTPPEPAWAAGRAETTTALQEWAGAVTDRISRAETTTATTDEAVQEVARLIDSCVPDRKDAYGFRHAMKAAVAMSERGLLATAPSAATTEDAARVIDVLGRHWWSTQTGETEPWGDLTDAEKANVIENAYIDVLATPVLGLLATARTRPTREQVIDALVMSPLSDTAGTDMRPFERTADAVLALLADQPDPADVWDQGYAAGKNDLRDGTPFRTFNPYRGGAR